MRTQAICAVGLQRRRGRARSCAQYAFMCAIRERENVRERGANKTLTAFSSSASDLSLKEISVLLVGGW